jgi:hypothetical protein
LLVDRSHNISINLATADGLHHCEMFEVVVSLEQGVASEELDKNASYTPNVARETTEEWYSSLNVADPKSIRRISGSRRTLRCRAVRLTVVDDDGTVLLYVKVW